jgi:hypothetical protein
LSPAISPKASTVALSRVVPKVGCLCEDDLGEFGIGGVSGDGFAVSLAFGGG